MGSKRLTPTRVGKMASKCLLLLLYYYYYYSLSHALEDPQADMYSSSSPNRHMHVKMH